MQKIKLDDMSFYDIFTESPRIVILFPETKRKVAATLWASSYHRGYPGFFSLRFEENSMFELLEDDEPENEKEF
jgi:hypothetical protein